MRIAVAGGTGRVGRHVVDLLEKSGHEAVPMSRSTGVDVVTGEGLAAALTGVECIVDAATGPSPDRDEAAAFFRAAVTNLQRAGEQAGVRRAVLVSIIGVDKLTTSYGAAKQEQEQAWLAGPIPVGILRADLFHEFVGPMMTWGRQGDVVHLPSMVRQPVAARSVAEVLAGLATAGESRPMVEVAGPRVENLVDLGAMLAARDGDPVKVVGVSDPDDADSVLYESGQVLPGPDAVIAGPAFAEWLERNPGGGVESGQGRS
ncbi:SDR family oxidoreductase [Jiangella rhizosphaerae]|uniref:Epimerase n=1 Tax=Jiangella rhizosphaerae TaxID=2293569 RepID=A0A418KKL7_9ACTN|nr:NAD(P)H-binding protein [Jiangella rhizosphaerae]RIQ17846.1 epimerase [Jiangella rhizosphaerae]